MEITTAEQLLHATELGRCELVRGEVRTLQLSSGNHGQIAAKLASFVGEHVREHNLGTVVACGTGFLLARDPDTVRAPDLGFVRAQHAADGITGYYPGAPDLAVEVLDADDHPGYVREKVAEWLEAGARAVWVVDPRRRTVVVHDQLQDPVTLEQSGTLRGDDLLPGFAIPVRNIFA